LKKFARLYTGVQIDRKVVELSQLLTVNFLGLEVALP
jgi:hypothetical protein